MLKVDPGCIFLSKEEGDRVLAIDADTEILVLGWPDPLEINYYGYVHRCALKDSLSRMENHIAGSDLSEQEKMYYQFSVLLTWEGGHRLLYTYYGDGEISVEDAVKDILHFD